MNQLNPASSPIPIPSPPNRHGAGDVSGNQSSPRHRQSNSPQNNGIVGDTATPQHVKRSGSSHSQGSSADSRGSGRRGGSTSRRRAEKHAQLAAAANANAAQMEELQKLLATQRMLMEAHASVTSPNQSDDAEQISAELLREKLKEKQERKDRREAEKREKKADKERAKLEKKSIRQHRAEREDAVGSTPPRDQKLGSISFSNVASAANIPASEGRSSSSNIDGNALGLPKPNMDQRSPSPMLLSTYEHLAATSVNTLMPIVPVSMSIGDGGNGFSGDTVIPRPPQSVGVAPMKMEIVSGGASDENGAAAPFQLPNGLNNTSDLGIGNVQQIASVVGTVATAPNPHHPLADALLSPTMMDTTVSDSTLVSPTTARHTGSSNLLQPTPATTVTTGTTDSSNAHPAGGDEDTSQGHAHAEETDHDDEMGTPPTVRAPSELFVLPLESGMVTSPGLKQPAAQLPFHAATPLPLSEAADPSVAMNANKSLTIIVEGGTSVPSETRAAYDAHSTHLKKRRKGATSPVAKAQHVVPVPSTPTVSMDTSPSASPSGGSLRLAAMRSGMDGNAVGGMKGPSLFTSPPTTPEPQTAPQTTPQKEKPAVQREASPTQDDRSQQMPINGLPAPLPTAAATPPTTTLLAAQNGSANASSSSTSATNRVIDHTRKALSSTQAQQSEATSNSSTGGQGGHSVTSSSVYTLIVPIVVEHLSSALDVYSLCLRFEQWALAAHPQLLESVLYGKNVEVLVGNLADLIKNCIPFLEEMLVMESSVHASSNPVDDGSVETPRHESDGRPPTMRNVTNTYVTSAGQVREHPSVALERMFDAFFVDTFGDEMPVIASVDESALFVEGFVKEIARHLGRQGQLPEDELRQWYSFCEVMLKPNRNGPFSNAVLAQKERMASETPNLSHAPSLVAPEASSSISGNHASSSTHLPKHLQNLQKSRTPVFIKLAQSWLPRYAAQQEEAYRQYLEKEQQLQAASNNTDAKSNSQNDNAKASENGASAIQCLFSPVTRPTSDLDSIKYGWTLIIKTTRNEFGFGIIREMLTMMPALGRTGPLRNANPQQLGAQLDLLFGTVIVSLSDVLAVIPSILQLGARHAGYGLTAEYAEVFVMALDATLARLLKEETYSQQMRVAWEGLARFILEVMAAGVQQPLPEKKRHRRGRDGQSVSSIAGGGDTSSIGSSRSRRSVSSYQSAGVSSRGGSQFHGHTLNPISMTHIKASTESMLSYERSMTSNTTSVNVLDDNSTTLLQLFKEVLRSDVTALLATFDELLSLCTSDLSQSMRYANHIITHELKLVPPVGESAARKGDGGGDGHTHSHATASPYSHHGGFDSSALVGMLLRYVSLLKTIFANRTIITIAAVKRALLFYRFYGFESFEPVRLLLSYVGGGRLRFELCMQRVSLPLSALFDSARSSDDFVQSARVLRECWDMVNYRELIPQLLFMISGQLAALPDMASWRTPSHFMRKVNIMGIVDMINSICGVVGIEGNVLAGLGAGGAGDRGGRKTPPPSASAPSTGPTDTESVPLGLRSPANGQPLDSAQDSHSVSGGGTPTQGGGETAFGGGSGGGNTMPAHALAVGTDVQRACARLGLWLRVLGLEAEAESVVEILITSIWDVLLLNDSARRYMLVWSFKHSICAMVQCGALPYPTTMADRRACDIHWRMLIRKLNNREIIVTTTGPGYGVTVGGGYASGTGGTVTVIDEMIRLLPQLKQGLFRRVSVNALNEVHKRFMTKIVDTALYGGGGAKRVGSLYGGMDLSSNPGVPSRRSIVSLGFRDAGHFDDDSTQRRNSTTSDNNTATNSDASNYRNVISLVIPPLAEYPASTMSGPSNSKDTHHSSLNRGEPFDAEDEFGNAYQMSDLPLRLPPADAEELSQLGLQHTIWGVLEEHYPVFITAFVSYLKLLHLQNPSAMPPVATVPVSSWLAVIHYIATKMSATAASARAMLRKHSNQQTVQKIILIQSLQRGRMARNDARKRRVFQDGIVRTILGVGPHASLPLPPGMPASVGANKYRQQAYFRMLEMERVDAEARAGVDGAEPHTDFDGIGGGDAFSPTHNGGRRLADGRQRFHQLAHTNKGSENSIEHHHQGLNSYNRKLPMENLLGMSQHNSSFSAMGKGSVTTTTTNASGLVVMTTTLNANSMTVNTVHVRGADDADDYDDDMGDGIDKRWDKGYRFAEEDDGLDWEVLDGQITPGLDRLLILLWASIGSQGRSGAVHGALREYSERFQRRLFGSSSANRAELKQAGDLIVEMMAFYGRLDESMLRSTATRSTSSSQRSGGLSSGEGVIPVVGSEHLLQRRSGIPLSNRGSNGSNTENAPNETLRPPPFVLKRLFQHDPSLHNLTGHHNQARLGPSPLMPFTSNAAPAIASPPLSAAAGQGGGGRFRHSYIVSPSEGAVAGGVSLAPSPPSSHADKKDKPSRKHRGSKSVTDVNNRSVTSFAQINQRPLLPTGEMPLTEVGLEEMVILFEDTDFGHILIERILAACPEEHKNHPAVRLAWLQLYSCILYHLKLLLEPAIVTPKRTIAQLTQRSHSSPSGGRSDFGGWQGIGYPGGNENMGRNTLLQRQYNQAYV